MLKSSRFTILVSIFAVLISGVGGHAAEIPPKLKSYLLTKPNSRDLVREFEAIPVVTPEEFVRRFLAPNGVSALGAGFNGIAFKNANRRVGKFIFRIHAAFGRVQLDHGFLSKLEEPEAKHLRAGWSGLFLHPVIDGADIDALRGMTSDVGAQPITDELMGTLLWALHSPEDATFPSMVSNDGLAFENELLEGVPLKAILESEREGTLLHQRFDIQKIWQKVTALQHKSEQLLREAGVTIDMFTPGNIMVGGTRDNPIVRTLDHALARPTPEAYRYYESIGVEIPKPLFEGEFRLIQWPTMPEHIVSNILWGLSFKQAVQFVKTYYGLSSDYDAIQAMARFGEWKIIEAPFLGNYTNVRKARGMRAMLGAARCGSLLVEGAHKRID